MLLGLRSNVLDSGTSPAEYLYGTTLKIPGEFILPEEFAPDPRIFLEEFREHMRLVKPAPVDNRNKRIVFFHKDLYSCSHVFLKVGTVKRSLECPYSGPHRVINRTSDRIFEIDINGVRRRVSVENVKPAFFVPVDLPSIKNVVCGHSGMTGANSYTPNVVDNVAKQFVVQKPLRTYVNKNRKVIFNFEKQIIENNQ